MKNANFSICDETIYPGESLSLALPLPELFSCAPMHMPIKVMHSKKPGPCLLVIAAIHGDALNGTEIINRLLSQVSIKRLKGTLIAAPVFNVYGFINKSRELPGGGLLHQSFPGLEDGTHAQRIAHVFNKSILTLADYVIDLQTGPLNYSNFPQIFIDFNNKKERELALACTAPIISNVKITPGSLRETTYVQKLPYLVYEAGEAMRFDENAIRMGLRSINNVMTRLEMFVTNNTSKARKSFPSFFVEGSSWVHAPTSGISYSRIKLGQQVEKDQLLSVIRDPFGAGYDVNLLASQDGIVVGKANLPLVKEGEKLFQLATFAEMDKAVSHFEDWRKSEHASLLQEIQHEPA